jgi:DNA-binding XRE family transcriptional regulator
MKPYILRRESAGSWCVGRPVVRKLNGNERETVELRDRHWYGSAQGALEALTARLYAPLYTPGPHVRAWRGKRSQASVARQAGISVRHLRRIERGECDPKAITLARLFRALADG